MVGGALGRGVGGEVHRGVGRDWLLQEVEEDIARDAGGRWRHLGAS